MSRWIAHPAILVTLVASVTIGVCALRAAPPAAQAAPATPATDTTAPGVRHVDLGVVTFDVPTTWISEEPSSSMRQAQLRIPHATAEAQDGELLVFFFGPSAGSVDANVQRWYAQIETAGGKPAQQVAQRSTFKAGDVDITLIDVSGKIKASSMPGAPAHPQIAKGRMLAAIAQTSMGPWFFKATGPAATMAGALAGFKGLLQSIKVTHASGSGMGAPEGPGSTPGSPPTAAPMEGPETSPDAGSDTEKH